VICFPTAVSFVELCPTTGPPDKRHNAVTATTAAIFREGRFQFSDGGILTADSYLGCIVCAIMT